MSAVPALTTLGAPEVLRRVERLTPFLQAQAESAEKLGRLPDETAQAIRQTGVMRLLQPTRWGGLEADPAAFFKAVMSIAAACGASGWVTGIVGIHAWELALCDPKLQKEVWADDADVWIASPYAPLGRATPTEGGYRFSGRWQFSSGTDHCQWIFLGGLIADEAGNFDPARYYHFVLPRPDYTIVDDSWDVVGLRGTGSKDIIVDDAFVPAYRTIEALKVLDGRAAAESGCQSPLFRMPWSALFPNGITSAIIGIAEGALAAHLSVQQERASAPGNHARADAFALAAVGEAASEIAASRAQLLGNVSTMYELAVAGKEIPYALRAQGRRDQVRGSWRAVRALDEIFARSGGGGLRTSGALQRLWRDAHAGLNHFINVADGVYSAYSLTAMGMSPPDGVRLTI